MGEPVYVVEQRGEWLRVVLPLQPSSLDARGYPGWIRASEVDDARSPVDGRTFQVQTLLASTPVTDETGQELASLPLGSILTVIPSATEDGRLRIRRGETARGYVHAGSVAPLPLQTQGRDLVLSTLGLWEGLPYVWGGTSSRTGTDCSGLVYRTYQRAGVRIPRDARDQFDLAPRSHRGTREGAQPGDLVFFKRASSVSIDHVGIYLGGDRYFSANQQARGVSVDAVATNDHPYVGWASYLP